MVEQATLGLLFLDRLFRQQIDQVELPLAGDAIPVGISLAEVITGIEKENGKLCIQFNGQPGQQHILGLKAARQAHTLLAGNFTRQNRAHLVQFGFDLCLDFRCAHHKPAFSQEMKMPASCNSRWTAEIA